MGGAFCVICGGYSAFLKQTIAPICWRCSKAHSGWSPLLAIMANEPLFLPRNVPPPANKGQDSRQCVGDNRAKPQRHFLRTLTATPESYKRQTRFVLAEGHFIVNTIYIYTLWENWQGFPGSGPTGNLHVISLLSPFISLQLSLIKTHTNALLKCVIYFAHSCICGKT